MPADADKTIPVLVHVDPKDWNEFKKLAGRRRASMRVRALIRQELSIAKATTVRSR